MRWRLLALITIAVLLSACEYTEILIINPDGTAVVRIEIDSDRDEFSDTIFFGIQWTTLQQQSTEFAALDDDRESIRVFIANLFALNAADEEVAELAESFVLDVDDDRFHISAEMAVPADLVVGPFGLDLPLFNAASIDGSDDGTFSLSIDARDHAADFVSDLNAIQGDPFTATLGDNPDHVPITMTAELQLPGEIDTHDAHEVDGNTLRWSWTVGQEGAAGLSAQWDPDPDDGFGVPREIVIWVVATIAVFGLGVLAATFGLFEAVRVRRRDRRHLG